MSCICRSHIAGEKSLSLSVQGAKATNTTSIIDEERNKQVCVPNVTELSSCEVVQPCLSPSHSHKGSKHTVVSLSPSAPKGSNVMFMSPRPTLEDFEQTSLPPASNAMLSLTSQSPCHSPKHSKLSLLSLSRLKHSNQALPSPSLSHCENGLVAFATRPCDPRTINSKQQIDLSLHDEQNAKDTSQNSHLLHLQSVTIALQKDLLQKCGYN